MADAQQPVFDRRTWVRVGDQLELRNLTPQSLRQNFVSYCASVGVPASIAALWSGHRARVAESHYRAQVLERSPGESIEEAMGLLQQDQFVKMAEVLVDEIRPEPRPARPKPATADDIRYESQRVASASFFEDLMADELDEHRPARRPSMRTITITKDLHVLYCGETFGPFTQQPLNMLREARYEPYVFPLRGDWAKLRKPMPFLDALRMLHQVHGDENSNLRRKHRLARDQIVLAVGAGLSVLDLADLYK